MGTLEIKQIPVSRKHSEGKPDITLIPLAALCAGARALEFGVDKYGRNNYRLTGISKIQLARACISHLYGWIEEDTDSESGLSHLDHAMANICMLIATHESGVDVKSPQIGKGHLV